MVEVGGNISDHIDLSADLLSVDQIIRNLRAF